MASFKGDPYWIKAKFQSTCKGCGKVIEKGEDIFFFPRSKAVFCGLRDCGIKESISFDNVAMDEAFYNGESF